jgi:hypothetical protein
LAGDGVSGDDVLSFDEVGDDITLYWLTATATSAARLYWESWDKDWGMMKVDIPVGYSIFPREIFRAPQDLLSHQRFSSRMALLCLKTGHHLAGLRASTLGSGLA